jgi:hypothetical protein
VSTDDVRRLLVNIIASTCSEGGSGALIGAWDATDKILSALRERLGSEGAVQAARDAWDSEHDECCNPDCIAAALAAAVGVVMGPA